MFPCACALRSTQCAALIALATAAGVARLEPVGADVGAGAGNTREAQAPWSAEAASAPQRLIRFFQVLRSVAPWLERFSASDRAEARKDGPSAAAQQEHRHRPAEIGPAVGLTAVGRAPVEAPSCFGSEHLGPSARQHALPFAHGPPQHGATSTRDVSTRAPANLPIEIFA